MNTRRHLPLRTKISLIQSEMDVEEEVKESFTESYSHLARRHLLDDKLHKLAASTFGSLDICDLHEGRMVFADLNSVHCDPACNKCPEDKARVPSMKLRQPIQSSADLKPVRETWMAARTAFEAKRAAAAKQKDATNRVVGDDYRELQAWQQYTLAAWDARNNVVAKRKTGNDTGPGTQACLDFIIQFVDDWQARFPPDDDDTKFESGPRPHIQCKLHGVPGAMFPVAGRHYDKACFICPLPIEKAPETNDDDVSEEDFRVLCGNQKAKPEPKQPTFFGAASSSSMEDE